MASTMRSLARRLPKPDTVEQKQEEPVAQVQAKSDPPPEPPVVSDNTVDSTAPVLEASQVLDAVDSVQSEPEAPVDEPSVTEPSIQAEPAVVSVPDMVPEATAEPVQPKPILEKKAKPKPPPKKPKAADQKKVNTPKVETDV